MKKLMLLFFVIIGVESYSQSIPIDSLYLGQKTPGNTPVIFAPGFISKPGSYEHDIAFSPDGKEMFYCISKPNWTEFKIHHAYWSIDHWTKPAMADFSNQYNNTEICFSPDGQSLLFASNRSPGSSPWNFAIIKLTKNAGQWGSPTEIGIKALQPSGNDGNWHPSITNDSIVYFSSYSSGSYDIYYSKLKNGVATNFVKMGNGINSSSNDWYPWIAPDNSYLIFSSERAGGSGQNDLYVSFRKADNSWTTPKNLGSPVNTSSIESCPRVTPDGKYLFFTRTSNWNGDFYWVSADFIVGLNPNTSLILNYSQNIKVYPNPSKGKVNISLGSINYKKANLKITDVQGKLIYSNAINNASNINIDLTNHPKGIYVLNLNIDGEAINKKICIE